MLKISRVRKVFNEGTVNEKIALREINLNVTPGEFITVIGSNGAGKSTLMNIISGGLIPDLRQRHHRRKKRDKAGRAQTGLLCWPRVSRPDGGDCAEYDDRGKSGDRLCARKAADTFIWSEQPEAGAVPRTVEAARSGAGEPPEDKGRLFVGRSATSLEPVDGYLYGAEDLAA